MQPPQIPLLSTFNGSKAYSTKTENKSLFALYDVLEWKKNPLKMTYDKLCTNNCMKKIILSYLSCVPNVSTGLMTEAELRMGSRELSCEKGSPARRFLMTDDVLSMQTQWAAIWNDLLSIGCLNQVDGLIYCCIRSRWFMNSPTGEPVE